MRTTSCTTGLAVSSVRKSVQPPAAPISTGCGLGTDFDYLILFLRKKESACCCHKG